MMMNSLKNVLVVEARAIAAMNLSAVVTVARNSADMLNGGDVVDYWRFVYLLLLFLIILVIGGNLLVIIAVLFDRKLRCLTTNKFIASLALSDLLVGIVVMPLSLYVKV